MADKNISLVSGVECPQASGIFHYQGATIPGLGLVVEISGESEVRYQVYKQKYLFHPEAR